MGQGSRRARRAFALLAVAAAVAVPAAFAGDSGVQQLGEMTPSAGTELRWEGSDLWFVELKGSAATFRQEAKSSGIKYSERFSYGRIWNGVSVQASPSQLGKLGGLSSVRALYPVETLELPEATPDLATAIAQTGADIAQNSLGLTGDGVKVAVMDTGIDYDHPDLGGCFGAGCRVETGWDFVGDSFNASQFNADGTPNAAYDPNPAPDADPDDCNGHGTHVSGIIGASPASASGVKGVAPGVTFGAYRVFGCGGSTTADIMLAAMERALADGMDILNMSIGSAHNTWPQYPTAAGSDALVDAGMVVVASIGNSGADGLYSAGAPGVGNNVIGTASFDNSHVELATFTVTPAGLTAGYGNAAAAPPAPSSGSAPLATPSGSVEGCVPADFAGFPAGSIALIKRGACTFHIKAANAQAAGAAAVVLYNNSAGRFSPTVAGPIAITIPVVAISDTEGNAIAAAMAGGPQTLNWQAGTGTFTNPTAGLLSSFTSYGLNAELTQKPDIGAPGGLIRSTYPLEAGGYATISGTSMSSPHVAGAAALLMEARPSLPAAAYRDVLQNSADPATWSGNPGLGFRDFSFRQGAGMVDIDDAVQSKVTVSPGKLSLGESSAGAQTRTLTVSNAGASDMTYTLGNLPGLSAGWSAASPYGFGVFTGFAGVAFSQPTVTVPAGGSASVDVTITANAGLADRSLYGGWITLTSEGAEPEVLRVVYSGLKGDYQSIVHMPSRGAFPALGRRTATPGAFYAVEPATGGTYTLANEQEIPQVLLHFDHQVRRLEIEVVRASDGSRLHPVFSNVYEEDYLAKNSTSGGFFAYPWAGGRLHSNGQGSKAGLAWKTVPDGTYKLNVKALKALGDAANPADWETWTSPAITIDRP